MIRRPPRSTQSRSSAASDVYKRQGTPYPEVTELICRIPLASLCRHALVFSTRGTSFGSWYGHSVPFSRSTGINRFTLSHIHPLLTITVLHRFRCLDSVVTLLDLP